MNSINKMAETYNMPIIYSVHPRSRNIIENRGFKFHHLVQSMKPFGFFDYNKLQKNAYCVLSDSGTLSEESSMLNFPGVLIRTSTERPEALDAGTIIVGGITEETVSQSIELAVSMSDNNEPMVIAKDYSYTNVLTTLVDTFV